MICLAENTFVLHFSLGARLSRPSGGLPACACLSCAGTGSRKEGRKKEGREGRREGRKDIYRHRRSTELEELIFLTLTLFS